MMPADEPTLGELWRRMVDIERRIDNGFSGINHQLESLQFVHRDLYESNQKAIWQAISELKDKSTWLFRTVAGTLITLAIGAFVALVIARGGV